MASVAPIAGIRKLARQGYFDGGPVTIAVTLTGHGLKDPDRAIKSAPHPVNVPASIDAVVAAIGF